MSSGIEGGLITFDRYAMLLKKELTFEKTMLQAISSGDSKSEDINRVKQRIQLIEKELSGDQGDAPPPESKVQAEVEAPTVAEGKLDKKITKKTTSKNADVENLKKKVTNTDSNVVKSNSSVFEGQIVVLPSIIVNPKANKEILNQIKERLDNYNSAMEYLLEVT